MSMTAFSCSALVTSATLPKFINVLWACKDEEISFSSEAFLEERNTEWPYLTKSWDRDFPMYPVAPKMR